MGRSQGSSSPSKAPAGQTSRMLSYLASRTWVSRSRRSSERCSSRRPRRRRIWRRTPAGSSAACPSCELRRRVALAAEKLAGTFRVVGPCDEDHEHAAVLRRDMAELEVLEIDLRGAEDLGDAR